MPNERKSLRQKTFSGFAWMSGGALAQALIQIIALAILARLVSPKEFGVLGAAMLVVGLAQLLTRFGLAQTLVQMEELEPRVAQTCYAIALLASIVTAALVFLLAPLAAQFFDNEQVEPVLRVLAVLFPLRGLATIAEAQVRRHLRFHLLAMLDSASLGIGYGLVGSIAAAAGLGVWALVAGLLAQAVIQTTALLILYPPRLRPLPDRASARYVARLGGGFTLGSVANYLAGQGDNIVVGHTLGPTSLGIYGRAYQMMGMPANLFGSVLDVVLFPAMARVQNQRNTLAKTYRRGVTAIALVTAPISIALAVLGDEVVRVLLGSQWGAVVVPFQILAVGTMFRTSYKMSESIARATGAVYRRAWRQGVFAALVIGGALIGQRWGVDGVAACVLFALAINYLLMAHLSLKLAGIGWITFWKAHVPALVLTSLAGATAFVAGSALQRAGVGAAGTLLVAGSLVAVVLLGAAWRFPRVMLGSDGVWMVDVIIGSLPGRRRGRRENVRRHAGGS